MTIPSDYSDLPPQWFVDLPVDTYLTSPIPMPSTNKFRVLCGQSIEEWEAAGWIDYSFDPRGWFQWYSRFYQGRRCGDDARQVGRWRRCVGPTGRWKRILLKRYKEKGIRDSEGDDTEDVSPLVHQTCHHVYPCNTSLTPVGLSNHSERFGGGMDIVGKRWVENTYRFRTSSKILVKLNLRN